MESKRPNTLMECVRHFDAETADRFIASIKWLNGPVCPNCGSQNVAKIVSRRRFQCRERACRKQFSLTTGTILEATHLRSDQWITAVWMIVNCRNGVSSCEIARTVGCKQQSGWHLLHRIREVIAPTQEAKMRGPVECDSTLVGGLLQNMPHYRRARIQSRDPRAGKTRVHAIKDRMSGNVRADIVGGETIEELHKHINENVERGSAVFTDSAKAYISLKINFLHLSVNHLKEEYVRGAVHVNGCESYFNCLRRGLYGTYVHASPEHLSAYVNEASYRYNIRHKSEWDRFETAMKKIVGKRLMYKTLTGGAIR